MILRNLTFKYILKAILLTISFTSFGQTFNTPQNIGGIINSYAAVTSIPSLDEMTVDNASPFNTCDKVLVIQMKGATISTNDDTTFGDISAIGNAGNFEYAYIQSISGNNITFQADLSRTYDANGLVQIVSVPQYQGGATNTSDLTAMAWNGLKGGILAFECTDFTMGHFITVDGLGFEKGEENGLNYDHCLVTDVTPSYDYASPVTDVKSAEKGEGIVVETNWLYGRGHLATGGGGGNIHNGGGGGGSNFGQGGLGGYSTSICSPTAAAEIQGQGIGGLNLAANIATNKIFLGGGGGAGQGNNNSTAPNSPNAQNDFNYGGNGGGIIIANIDNLIITWSTNFNEWVISANGEDAPQNTGGQTPVLYDGAGGGGGGGSILINIGNIDNQTGDGARNPIISATGGIGGYNMNGSTDCYAPGGGGGGGIVWWAGGTRPANVQSLTINGGAAGQKNPAQACAGTYGATAGTTGNELFNHTIPLAASSGGSYTVTIAEDTNNVCENTTIQFSSNVIGGIPTTYQWLWNNSIDGGNISTYSENSFSNGDSVQLRTIFTSGCSGTDTAYSNVIYLETTPQFTPSVLIDTDTNNVCPGTLFTFSANPTGGGASPTYQWKLNGVNIGTDAVLYSIDSLNNGDLISLELISDSMCTINPVSSNVIVANILTNITPAVSITEDVNNICLGETITFSSNPTTGTPAQYDWLWNNSIDGGDSSSYANTTFADQDSVQLRTIYNIACSTSDTALSNVIYINISSPVVPTLSIDEDTNGVCGSTNIVFNTIEAGATPTSYQWFLNNSTTGINSSTYNNSTFSNGDSVQLRTIYSGCVNPDTLFSNVIYLNILPSVTPLISINSDTNNVCDGASINFISTPINGGVSPSFQWQVNGSNSGTDSIGFTSSILNNGDLIRVIFTSDSMCAINPAVSDTIIAIIQPNSTPSLSISEDFNNVCEGTLVSFTATPINGGTSPVYQWYLNGIPVGTNVNSYSLDSLDDNDIVTAGLTSTSSCATSDSANSNSIAMTMIQPPSLTIIEPNDTICDGSQTTFSALSTSGTTLNWILDNIPIGETTAAVSVSDPGIYRVIADDGTCPADTSGGVSLVNLPTPIVDAGSDIDLDIAQSTNLNATVTPLDATVIWSTNIGEFGDVTSLNSSYTPINVGQNSYTITASNGTCTDSDVIIITVTGDLYIPNVFTPNGDGIYDEWIISGIEAFPNKSLKVFNRWGTVIYESIGDYIEWNGQIDGQDLPVATYYWVLDPADGSKVLQGAVTIIR